MGCTVPMHVASANASKDVDVDTGAVGAGAQAVVPASGPGFLDGQPLDMRTRGD